MALIDAAIAFANGEPPSDVFGPLVARSREDLKRYRLADLARLSRGHRPRPDTDPLGDVRLWLRHQLIGIALANELARKARRPYAILKRGLAEIAEALAARLGKVGPRALVVEGLMEHAAGRFAPFRVSLWNDAHTCAKDALALLLSDYRGTRARLSFCPYGFPESVSLRPEDLDREFNNLAIKSAVHFFVDTRFVKGARMRYCTPRHQRAHYMQKYRARQKMPREE